MTRQHGTMGTRYPVEVTDEHGRTTIAPLFPPKQPTRRRSPDLSAYDRLDPPKPRRYGKGRMSDVDGMDRLRAALDELGAKMKAATTEALKASAEKAMRDAMGVPGAKVETSVGFDPAGPGPDRVVYTVRAADGRWTVL